MTKLNDLEKVKELCDLLDAGHGTVEVADLLNMVKTPRRARRAIFMARKGGMILEAVRTQGRGVTQYIRVTPEIGYKEIENAIIAKRKRKPKNVALTALEENVHT